MERGELLGRADSAGLAVDGDAMVRKGAHAGHRDHAFLLQLLAGSIK